MPLLSIIVPVYNTEEYIRQCLESIINQNNGDLEVILVDDGSTDSSGVICDEYANKYPSLIKVVHKKNEGSLLARRSGYAICCGKYIAHVDADDYLLDNALSIICDAIKQWTCDMVFFDGVYGAGQGKPERIIKPWEFDRISCIETKKTVLEKFIFGKYLNSLCLKVSKKELFDFDKDYSIFKHVANGDDALQSLALFDKAESFLYIPKPLYYYRRNNISLSKCYSVKDYYSFRTLYTEMYNYTIKWNMTKNQLLDLKNIILEKNIVILHDVRKSSTNLEYNSLLKVMSKDAYFIDLYGALDSTNINKYNRIIYLLLSKRLILLTRLFIALVQGLKRIRKG